MNLNDADHDIYKCSLQIGLQNGQTIHIQAMSTVDVDMII